MSNISGNTFFIQNSVNCSDLGSINGQVTFIGTSKNCGQVLNAIFSGNGVCNEGQAYGCTVFYNSYNYGYVCGTGILREGSVLYGGADCVILCDQSIIDSSAEVTDYELLVNTPRPVNSYSLDGCYYIYLCGQSTLATGAWSDCYYCDGTPVNFIFCNNGVEFPLAACAQDVSELSGCWFSYSSNTIQPVPACGNYFNVSLCDCVAFTGTSFYPLLLTAPQNHYTIYVSGSGYNILSGLYLLDSLAFYYNDVINCDAVFLNNSCETYFEPGIALVQNSNCIYGKNLYANISTGLIFNDTRNANIVADLSTFFYSNCKFKPSEYHIGKCYVDWNSAVVLFQASLYEVDLDYYCSTPQQAADNCLYYIYQSGNIALASGAYSNYYVASDGSLLSNKNTIPNFQFPEIALDNGCYYYYVNGCACDPFLLKKVFPFSDQVRICAVSYLREEDVPDFINHNDTCAIYSYFPTGSYGTGIVHSEAPSVVIYNQPFLSKNCSCSYFLIAGPNAYTVAKPACTFATPVAAGTDSFLNDLTSCAIEDKFYFTFDCGTSCLANGYYSNGIFCGNGKLNIQQYPCSTPQCALDNACYYIYDTGYQAILANGNFSNGYFCDGVIDGITNAITPTTVIDIVDYYIIYCNGCAVVPNGIYTNYAFANCSAIDVGYNCLLPQQPLDDVACENTPPYYCSGKYYVYIGGSGYGATGAYSNFYYFSDFVKATAYNCTGLGSPEAAQDDCKYYQYYEGCPFIVTGCRNDVPGYNGYPSGIYNFGDAGEYNPTPNGIDLLYGPYIYTYYSMGVPNYATGVVSWYPTSCYPCCGPNLGCTQDCKLTWLYHSTLCCGYDPVCFGYGTYGADTFTCHTVTCTTESSNLQTCYCCYNCNNQLCVGGIVLIDNRFWINLAEGYQSFYNGLVNLQCAGQSCWACCDVYCADYCTCTFDVYCNLYCDVYNTEDPPVCIGQECCGQECCGTDSCQVCCGQSCCGGEVICNYSCIYQNALGFTDGYITGYHTYLCILQGETVTCESLDIVYDDLINYIKTTYGVDCQIKFIDLV